MAVFEIGQPSPLGNTIPEGAICDIDDSGLLVVMNFGVPTLDERAAFKTGAPYEFRLVRLRGVLFLLARLGSMPWTDMPYSPHLSKCSEFQFPAPNTGYATTTVLIDSRSHIVRGLRLIGLSTSFSAKLYEEVVADLQKPFDHAEYLQSINDVYNAYSTKDMLRYSFAACKG